MRVLAYYAPDCSELRSAPNTRVSGVPLLQKFMLQPSNRAFQTRWTARYSVFKDPQKSAAACLGHRRQKSTWDRLNCPRCLQNLAGGRTYVALGWRSRPLDEIEPPLGEKISSIGPGQSASSPPSAGSSPPAVAASGLRRLHRRRARPPGRPGAAPRCGN